MGGDFVNQIHLYRLVRIDSAEEALQEVPILLPWVIASAIWICTISSGGGYLSFGLKKKKGNYSWNQS